MSKTEELSELFEHLIGDVVSSMEKFKQWYALQDGAVKAALKALVGAFIIGCWVIIAAHIPRPLPPPVVVFITTTAFPTPIQPLTPTAFLAIPASTPAPVAGSLLQKMDFTYSDSPESHGWRISGASPRFTGQTDGFQGSYLIVEPSGDYAMSIDVDEKALNGTNIEFVSKYDANAAVYALVKMTGQDQNTSQEGMLKFLPGAMLYNKVDDDEWEVRLAAIPQGGGWSLFKIDLADAVRRTYGDQGWQYSQILGFRVRGKISLSYIAIYK